MCTVLHTLLSSLFPKLCGGTWCIKEGKKPLGRVNCEMYGTLIKKETTLKIPSSTIDVKCVNVY